MTAGDIAIVKEALNYLAELLADNCNCGECFPCTAGVPLVQRAEAIIDPETAH